MGRRRLGKGLALVLTGVFWGGWALAAPGAVPQAAAKGMTLWQFILAGGTCMIFLGLISVAATACVIYHFWYVTPERLVPRDFTENLLYLLEKKEFEKGLTVCKQQSNLIADIAREGLSRLAKGRSVVEEVLQYEGKSRIERLWQNLSYLGDMAVVAPMLGLLGTILGMIEAFNFQAFKAGIIQPVSLAQGLAKAMITTAFGLIIAVPILIFYSYFRGRVMVIASSAERALNEIIQVLPEKEGARR